MKVFYKMAMPILHVNFLVAGIFFIMAGFPARVQAEMGAAMPNQTLLVSVSNATAVQAADYRMYKKLERRFNRWQRFLKKHIRGYYDDEGGWHFEWTLASIAVAIVGAVSLVLMFATPWFFSLYLVLLAIMLLVLKGFGVLHF
jgi:hypothetical protein